MKPEPIEFTSEAEYAKLQADSEIVNARPKRFESVQYDEKTNRVSFRLARGMEVFFPVCEISELAGLSAKHLKELRLSLSGEALVLSSADVHISTGGLLRDMVALFPPEIIAAQFAASGGARTSAAKKAASAANGKLGGRQKKREATS